MAAAAPAGRPGAAAAELGPLRDRIDEITVDMVRLLKERTDIAVRIGKAKRSAGMGIPDARREKGLRLKVDCACAEIGADAGQAGRLLDLLFDESVRVQSAAQGPGLGGAGAGARAAAPGRAAQGPAPTPSAAEVFLRARRLEAQGRPMIHMEVGEPDFGPPERAVAALSEACGSGRCGYGPPAGTDELRDALAAHASRASGRPVSRENVMVTAGARFAIYLATASFLGPGDEAVVIEPAWPAYADCVRRAGASVRAVRTTLEGRWAPDLGEVERAASGPRVRMIILNYPNNPTGRILTRREFDGMLGIAERRGLRVISDEIYSEYAFDWGAGGGPAAAAPTACGLFGGGDGGGCITAQSFSKSHAMTGFRIGYAVGPAGDIAAMSALQATCMTCVPSPVQHSALAALGTGAAASNARAVRARLDAMCGAAEGAGLEFARPDGAMYLFARGRSGASFDGTRLANTLLDYGVAVAPGAGFGMYGDFIRMAACVDEGAIARAVGTIGRVIGSGGAAAGGRT